jgi:hypothetical protein
MIFGLIGRFHINFIQDEQDSDLKKEKQETFNLAFFLLGKYFSKVLLGKYISELIALETDYKDDLEKEQKRSDLIQIFEKMLEYPEREQNTSSDSSEN